MSKPVRSSVKVLLLNQKNELLLMCAHDPKTTAPDGKYHGQFWFTPGGRIEKGESIQEAALRELYEETGITKDEVDLGPVVWYGEFDLILDGILTCLKQTFIVAKTKRNDVSFINLDKWEKDALQKLAWFSFEKIIHSKEIIYPVVLPQYLPDIISGNYPKKPLKIDLAKQPK